MKWFFLGALVLFGVLFNALAMDATPAWRVPIFIALNAALIGIGFIWHCAYYEAAAIQANNKDRGLVLLCIAVGAFISMGGLSAILSESCTTFLSDRPYRLRNAIVRFIESIGYCAELGHIVLAAGILIVLSGLKIGLRIRQKRGFP